MYDSYQFKLKFFKTSLQDFPAFNYFHLLHKFRFFKTRLFYLSEYCIRYSRTAFLDIEKMVGNLIKILKFKDEAKLKRPYNLFMNSIEMKGKKYYMLATLTLAKPREFNLIILFFPLKKKWRGEKNNNNWKFEWIKDESKFIHDHSVALKKNYSPSIANVVLLQNKKVLLN